MDEQELFVDNDDPNDAIEGHNYRACYIFKPTAAQDDHLAEHQPVKKRKLTTTTPALGDPWPRLLNGHEATAQASRRQQLFRQFWHAKQSKLDDIVNYFDESTLSDLERFVVESGTRTSNGRLPTALLTLQNHSQGQLPHIQRLKQKLKSQSKVTVLIELPSRQSPNLQLTLKTIIRLVLTELTGVDGYTQFLAKHKRLHPLNFDLELLQIFLQEHPARTRIVISLENAEEFENNVFNSLVQTLQSWSDRIQFVLLLGITTTVSLFETRLPKRTIRNLQARIFAFKAPLDLDVRLVDALQLTDLINGVDSLHSHVFLGPDMVRAVRDSIASQNVTTSSVLSMIKHACMAHYYSNPVTALLDPEPKTSEEKKTLAQAIRCMRSFQDCIEESMSLAARPKQPVLDRISKLLQDDQSLLDVATEQISHGQQSYILACSMASAVTSIYFALLQYAKPTDPHAQSKSPFDVYTELYSSLDDMTQAPTFSEIESMLEHKNSQHALDSIVRGPEPTDPENVTSSSGIIALRQVLQILLKNNSVANSLGDDSQMLQGLVKQKLEAQKTSINKDTKLLLQDSSLTIAGKLSLLVRLASCDLHDSSTFMRDAYIIQPATTSITKATFNPRMRYSIERALGEPRDYLGTYTDDHAPPPPASILFALLQEAPQTINVRDLYDAFVSRFNENKTDADEDINEKQDRLTMALFYRALSELKTIGLVKSSSGTTIKRKGAKGNNADVDFIAKTTWAGL